MKLLVCFVASVTIEDPSSWPRVNASKIGLTPLRDVDCLRDPYTVGGLLRTTALITEMANHELASGASLNHSI